MMTMNERMNWLTVGRLAYDAQYAVHKAVDARAAMCNAICDLVHKFDLRKAESPWTDLSGDWLTDAHNKAEAYESAAANAAEAIDLALKISKQLDGAEEAVVAVLPPKTTSDYWRDKAGKAEHAAAQIYEANYLPHGWTGNSEIVRLLGLTPEQVEHRALLDSLFGGANAKPIEVADVAKRRKDAQDWLVFVANGYGIEATGNMYP